MCSPAALHSFRFLLRANSSLFLLIVLSLCFSPVYAQTNPPADQVDDEDIVRVSTDLLIFPIRVKNSKGEAVAGLTEKDLRVDDKDRAISNLYLVEGVDRVALVFALDQSGSVKDVVTDQRDAALALFDRFNQRSSVAVLQFAESPKIVVPFDKDSSAAVKGFVFQSGRDQRTAIFDAAAKSIEAFQVLPRVRAERRIVILISDGLDTASAIKPNAVISEALRKRISFYVIHLPLFEPRDGRLAIRTPSRGFRDLAEKTGGKYFLVRSAREALSPSRIDLAPIFQAIEEDLKSQYLLGVYVSESAKDQRKHSFTVSFVPEGIKYALVNGGYSRDQKFHVQTPIPGQR
jgi:Ca-activated chloride channel homolog